MPPPLLNPHMFRAYDIRGVVGEDLTPASVEVIGRAFGTFLRRQRAARLVVVGRDNRPSSASLRDALVTGLRGAGLDVVDIGLSPSPLLYYAAALWGADGGVNITGSHNPIHMNGLKLLEQAALPLSPEDIQAVRLFGDQADFDSGAGGYQERDPKPDYFALLERRFPVARPLSVVVDPGNGVATLTGPEALRRIGCRVHGIYTELDGAFPHHIPDPQNAATMRDLQQEVRGRGADLGIAWDGDGDRLGMVDERGVRHEADELLAVLARDVLSRHPGERILVDVKISLSTVRDIERHGGVPVFGPTGHSLGKRKMRAEGILFGGEGSAHFYFNEDYYGLDDAVFGACMLASMIARGDQPASAYFEGFDPLVTSPELQVPCPDAAKFRVAGAVAETFRRLYPVLAIDGARIDFGDGWALVRASNTNPQLTVRLEAATRARYAQIREIVWRELARYPEVTLAPGLGDLPPAPDRSGA